MSRPRAGTASRKEDPIDTRWAATVTPGASGRNGAPLRALVAGAAACALLAGNIVLSHRHGRYEWRDWLVFTAAVRSYLDSRAGDRTEGSGEPGWAVPYCSHVAGEKVAALGIRPWQFWRTIQPRPFIAERLRLSTIPRNEDPGRAALLALGFRALGGIAPFLLVWLAAFAAVPVLFWSSFELSRAGYPLAAALYPCALAAAPPVAEDLSGPSGFSLVALLALVPQGAYAARTPTTGLGLVSRVAAAGAVLSLCLECDGETAALVPSFAVAWLLAARAGTGPRGGPRSLAPSAVLLAVTGGLLALQEALGRWAIPPGGGHTVSGLWVWSLLGGSLAVEAAVRGPRPVPAAAPPLRLSPGKASAFWAVMLFLPLGLTIVALEVAVRTVARHYAPTDREGLERRLQKSARADVTEVADGNLQGLVKPSPWKDVVYELKASHDWLLARAHVRTNSLGFRGHEYSLQKPGGTFRIAGIGDSVMFGWGVGDDETYMSLLEKDLAARRAGAVEALNFAVPGYNTAQEVGLFREKCRAFDPDVLLINYVLNDWAAPFLLPDPDDRSSIVERSRLLEMVRLRLHRDASRDDYFANPGLRGVFASLRELAVLTRERGIPVVFYIYPEPLDAASQEMFRTWVKEDGFLYVDMFEAFGRYCREHHLAGPQALYVSRSDQHPNAEGHRLIAATVEPVLAKLMDARPPRGSAAVRRGLTPED